MSDERQNKDKTGVPKPIYDSWVRSSENLGFSLKMYDTGGVVLEYKRFNPDTRRYERSAPRIALSWTVVEELRSKYHEIKALRERQAKLSAPAPGGGSHG